MLLQSRYDQLNANVKNRYTLELLPAVPDAWKSGCVSGLKARGGIEVAMTWKEGRVVEASLVANNNCEVMVVYNGQQKLLKLKKGKLKIVR